MYVGDNASTMPESMAADAFDKLRVLHSVDFGHVVDLIVNAYSDLVHKTITSEREDGVESKAVFYEECLRVSSSLDNNMSSNMVFMDSRLLAGSSTYYYGVEVIERYGGTQVVPTLQGNVRLVDIAGRVLPFDNRLEGCSIVCTMNECMDYVEVDNMEDCLVHPSNSELVETCDGYRALGMDNVIYCEEDGEYYYEESNMPETSDDYNFSWHGSPVQWHKSTYDSDEEYRVGFEVEKEDHDLMTSYYAQDLLSSTKYRKESDGSLDDDEGYELISPVYKFDLKLIEKDIRSHSEVLDLLTGNGSSACGTHITVSKCRTHGSQIFDQLVHWLPLLYALYPSRSEFTSSGYSKAKHGKNCRDYLERHGSLHVSDDKVEIRIFPVTRSLQQLLWRLGLVRILLDIRVASMKGIRKYCRQGRLHKHLMKVYDGNQYKIDNLLERAESYSQRYQLT